MDSNIPEFLHSLREFFEKRDWNQFHSPKNLVMDLGSEVGELLDHFRWLTEEESYHPKKYQDIKEEIGDIYIALYSLATKLKVDPLKEAQLKLIKMEERYPIEKFKGLAKKYNDEES